MTTFHVAFVVRTMGIYGILAVKQTIHLRTGDHSWSSCGCRRSSPYQGLTHWVTRKRLAGADVPYAYPARGASGVGSQS